MLILIKNLPFRFIKFEENFIICSNDMKIYRFTFSADVKFFSISKYHINHDLLDLILEKLPEVGDQITLTTLNSDIFNRLNIKKLNARSDLNNQLLKSKNCYNQEYLWVGLIELDAYDNKKITDVSFMASTLRILDASGSNCGIDQAGIQNLQLTKLNVSGNKKIKDVSFMAPTLRILDAVGYSGIDQNGIQNLQLIQLNASHNEKIMDVNFMVSTLRVLHAAENCGINQDGIKNLTLVELNSFNNDRITDVNFMKDTLRILYAGGDCGIDQAGIQDLKLIELNAFNNEKIKM